MQFVRGNLALRDHAENGEDVHLFEQEAGGLRYVGQVVVAGWNWQDDVPDRNKNLRRAIVFDLVAFDDELGTPTPSAPTIGSSDPRWTMPLDDLRSRSARTLGEPPGSTVAKRNVYQRSDDLKVYREDAGRRIGGSVRLTRILFDSRSTADSGRTLTVAAHLML